MTSPHASISATLWNSNQRYPGFKNGGYVGKLVLDHNGMAFRGNNSDDLVIPWEDLIDTSTGVRIFNNATVWFVWIVTLMVVALTVNSLGIIMPRSGVVYVRFRDREYRRNCLVEFASNSISLTPWGARGSAQKLERNIWDAKKLYYRGLHDATRPQEM